LFAEEDFDESVFIVVAIGMTVSEWGMTW
jgi:hypothetical protein